MTEQRGDHGFSVAPRRLGDGPSNGDPHRARRLGVAIVLVAGLAIVTIALAGPRLDGRPNLDLSFFATPTPAVTPTPAASVSPRPSPSVPFRATPLPEITRPEGPSATGRVAIGVDGMRVLDLAAGTIEKSIDMVQGRDAIVAAPGGAGWTCVCFVDDVVDGQPVRIVRIVGIDPAGGQTGATNVLTLPATFPEAGTGEPATDVDVRADGRVGLLAIGASNDAVWTFKVTSLDLDERRRGPIVDLGDLSLPTPSPSPGGSVTPSATPGAPTPEVEAPAESYLDGPHVRMAPDGRTAFVWAVIQSATQEGPPATAVRAWLVALDANGAVGEVAPADGLADLPVFCPYLGFAARDRLAWVCPRQVDESSGVTSTWELGTVDLDGRSTGRTQIPGSGESFFSEPLFDRANGTIYVWDPIELVLMRVDAHTLAKESVTMDPAAGAAPGIAPGGGSDMPDWRDANSSVQVFFFGQQVSGSTGPHLYLVGFKPITSPDAYSQASLGIFVVDRSTLALVDRWAPAAGYLAISVMANGQVLAVGSPGVDAEGREAPWQGSLTVHDPSDGRILVRYGHLGQDSPPLIFDR